MDGYHPEGALCVADECEPDCDGRSCGPDGCGGVCSPGCETGQVCVIDGSCHEPAPGLWVVLNSTGDASFDMGSRAGEAGRDDDEVQHEVELTIPFAVLSTEVTQDDFSAVMSFNPSEHTSCGACPVETVDWHQAAAYCNALSDAEDLARCYDCDDACVPSSSFASPYECPGYRLPTEAEWELAARAGTLDATYAGDLDSEHLQCEAPNDVLDPIAWTCSNGGDETHEAGGQTPNDWGLYDVLGNVFEWCHDWSGAYPTGSVSNPWGPSEGVDRVARGGSFSYFAKHARSAARNAFPPESRYGFIGFRPVRSLKQH
jgi:formylglycine-generating enzyme required for sulfatase activity